MIAAIACRTCLDPDPNLARTSKDAAVEADRRGQLARGAKSP